MKRATLVVLFIVTSLVAAVAQQPIGDVLGVHNLSPNGPSPVQGGSSAACLYCHAPHSGVGNRGPLWGQALPTESYSLYSSPTLQNIPTQPTVSGRSILCLSCHDGAVAVGTSVPSGKIFTTGAMYDADKFGSNLGNSHPTNMKVPLVDAPDLVASLAASQTTADDTKSVKLIDGTVECRSCHEPHYQNIDTLSPMFLVRSGANGAICLSCHEGSKARTVNSMTNPLALWSTSAHALAGNSVSAQAKLGSYNTVAQFACMSCHVEHNANGAEGLLRAPASPPANVDSTTLSCMNCHAGGTNVDGTVPDVVSEIAKGGHPYANAKSLHRLGEPVVLDDNRHATCADCHNPHEASPVATFTEPPAIRVSQTGTQGATSDGTAPNQYDNCFRCHGTSRGKQAVVGWYLPLRAVGSTDRLNIITQFDSTLASAHPVTHDGSGLPQPSLRKYMLKEDGTSDSNRPLSASAGARIFCSDCHNSDDNREFGGSGANGPHGSKYIHILERRYDYNSVTAGTTPPVTGPGSPITNLIAVNLSASSGADGGPYALCGKCHDLSNIMTDASFAPRPGAVLGGGHSYHINAGFACTVCHTSHGIGAAPGAISGERLVDFDVNVVGANNNAGIDNGVIAYSRNGGNNSCTLMCHGYNHNSDGTVTLAQAPVTGTTSTTSTTGTTANTSTVKVSGK